MQGSEVRLRWSSGDGNPTTLGPDDVHVWAAAIGPESHVTGLTPAERTRAGALTPDAGVRFRAARSALRRLLATYLGARPEAVDITVDRAGRPCLAQCHGSDVNFSVSHSGSLALVALTRSRRIGVDVERVRCLRAPESVAATFLSAGARRALADVSDRDRPEWVLARWVESEAACKALGVGMAAALTSTNPRASAGLAVARLDPAVGYVAAVAFDGRCPVIRVGSVSLPATAVPRS